MKMGVSGQVQTFTSNLKLGSLGPRDTSSEASLQFLRDSFLPKFALIELQLYENFDSVMKALSEDAIDFGVVPNAYANINNFYMSDLLQIIFVYIFATPEYILAKKPGRSISGQAKLTLHPATVPLIQTAKQKLEALNISIESEFQDSTYFAAAEVFKEHADLCITNENARNEFNLETLFSFGPIRMGWSVFSKRGRFS